MVNRRSLVTLGTMGTIAIAASAIAGERADSASSTSSTMDSTKDITNPTGNPSSSGALEFSRPETRPYKRTIENKLCDTYNLRDFGTLQSNKDNSDIFIRAAQIVSAAGGGTIEIPPGRWNASNIPLDTNLYWKGAGIGATTISQQANNNCDIFATTNFSALHARGPLAHAPVNFGVSDLTIDGNYLADYHIASTGGDTSINNSKGYGVRIFGSKFRFDVEVVNCPEVGFYSEAVNYSNYGFEQSSLLKLTGRVFGKEAMIYRGPADCYIDKVFLGCAGWLATSAERNKTIVFSSVYPDQPVDVMVSDESEANDNLPYNGHHEFGILHLYGNLNGLGYRCRNTGRVKGNHLITENCRGGAYFDQRTWGSISILEAHNNGRLPEKISSVAAYPDIEVASLGGMSINATVRRTQTQAGSYLALRSTGRNQTIKLNYFCPGTPPKNSPVAIICSESSDFDINCEGVDGDAIIHQGTANRVTVNGRNVLNGSLLKRASQEKGDACANTFRLTAWNCDVVLSEEGITHTDSVNILAKLRTGQKVSLTRLNITQNNSFFEIAAQIGHDMYNSHQRGQASVTADQLNQTVEIEHKYFQQPEAEQISVTIRNPAPGDNVDILETSSTRIKLKLTTNSKSDKILDWIIL